MESSSESADRSLRLDTPRATDAQAARAVVRGGQPGEGDEDIAEAQRGRNGGRPWFRRRGVVTGGAILLCALAALVALWWWHESGIETTDDAYIEAHIVNVSPQVAGQVIQVHVEDNQLVHGGQALVQIDPAPYRIALEQALATKRQAETALGQAQAGVSVAQASLAQAKADLASTTATELRAQQDFKRYQFLRRVNPRAVARTTVDQVIATAHSAAAELRAARQRVQSAEAQVKSAQAAVAGARAGIATAQARVAQARLDLGYTTVTALVAGHIANRSVAVGTYVAPGQQMMAIVPLHLWVRANFKETMIPELKPGQRVSIHIDACPQARATGHVISIQRGAGQAFELLPPENATGNFIKIVQRVPVRISLDSASADCVLGPGMSVEPTVEVR